MTDSPADKDSSAAEFDLMHGWTWPELMLPALTGHLPESPRRAELIEQMLVEFEPLTAMIDEMLANRATEATLEERVLALERKILMLRRTDEMVIGVVVERMETVAKALQLLTRQDGGSRLGGRASSSSRDGETAKTLARRRRMLGQ